MVLERYPHARAMKDAYGWKVVAAGEVLGTGLNAKVAWGQAAYRTGPHFTPATSSPYPTALRPSGIQGKGRAAMPGFISAKMNNVYLPETDPVNLGWHIYRMNDCDWWVARSLNEAKRDYMDTVGPMDEEEAFDESGEISQEEYDRLQFTDCDEDERPTGLTLTFRGELCRRVTAGLTAPEMFASTEQ